MTATLRVFVSSVQKELEDERLVVQNLVNTTRYRLKRPTESSSNRKDGGPNRKVRGHGEES